VVWLQHYGRKIGGDTIEQHIHGCADAIGRTKLTKADLHAISYRTAIDNEVCGFLLPGLIIYQSYRIKVVILQPQVGYYESLTTVLRYELHPGCVRRSQRALDRPIDVIKVERNHLFTAEDVHRQSHACSEFK